MLHMFTLQSLREKRAIVRWMLVWFVLSMGVAVAAPVVNPQALSLVCSASGKVLMVSSDDGSAAPAEEAAHAIHCVMCLPASAPPAADFVLALPTSPVQAKPVAPPAQAHWRLAEPTSARDPPVFL